jgi:hypothetical protein
MTVGADKYVDVLDEIDFVDFTGKRSWLAMSGKTMKAACGDNPARWADAFAAYAKRDYGVEFDASWLRRWFEAVLAVPKEEKVSRREHEHKAFLAKPAQEFVNGNVTKERYECLVGYPLPARLEKERDRALSEMQKHSWPKI